MAKEIYPGAGGENNDGSIAPLIPAFSKSTLKEQAVAVEQRREQVETDWNSLMEPGSQPGQY